jgi:hypothetical protein
MSLRLALVTLAAVVAPAAPAQAQHPQTARLVYSDTRVTLAGTESNDATVALGATVRFEYPEGTAAHNVNFERPGPECTQLAGAGTGTRSRILPTSPEGPGWVVECRFDLPGVYHFGSDDNGTLNGVVRVANADGSVPVDTPAPPSTQPEIFVPGQTVSGGGSTTTRPGSATPRTALKWTISAARRGATIRAVVTGGSERGRIAVEALATRTDLRAKGKARLVRVGRVTKTVAAGARVTVSVPLDAKAKAALRRLKRLKVTLRVIADGKTQSKTVTLRR